MPSPTWSTLPTSARSVSTSYSSIRCLRIEVISSGRSFTFSAPCGRQFLAQLVQSSAAARVDAARADLEDEAADQLGVDLALGLDAPAGGALDLAEDLLGLLVGELVRGRQLDVEHALVRRDEPLELRRDGLQ